MDDGNLLKRDLWFGFAATAFSLFFAASTVGTVESRGAGVTGRTFPYLIAAALFLMGVCFTVGTWRKLKAAGLSGNSPSLSMAGIRRIVLYLAAVCLYVVGMETLGYVVSTMAALLFLMLYTGARNRLAIVLMAVLVPACMWLTFAVLMEVQFPEALLF